MSSTTASHGITWEQLWECPASDLQEGDIFVEPGMGSAYWTLLDGNVQGAGLGELDGTAWTVLRRDSDRIRARSHEGRESTFRIRAGSATLRVARTLAQVEARRALLEEARRVRKRRQGTGRPGDGWDLVEANYAFELLYRGAQHTAVLGASDDGTQYEIHVYNRDRVEIRSDSFEDLDAAFRAGATSGRPSIAVRLTQAVRRGLVVLAAGYHDGQPVYEANQTSRATADRRTVCWQTIRWLTEQGFAAVASYHDGQQVLLTDAGVDLACAEHVLPAAGGDPKLILVQLSSKHPLWHALVEGNTTTVCGRYDEGDGGQRDPAEPIPPPGLCSQCAASPRWRAHLERAGAASLPVAEAQVAPPGPGGDVPAPPTVAADPGDPPVSPAQAIPRESARATRAGAAPPLQEVTSVMPDTPTSHTATQLADDAADAAGHAAVDEAATAEPTKLVPIELLDPAPDNPRAKLGNTTDLAASIEQHGILQDLLVTRRGGRYLIVAGHRRHKAAKQAGKTHVPCKIRELTDQQRRQIMLVENLQRDDLTPLEEARGYQALLEEEPDLSQHDIARRIGRVKSQGLVSRRLSLLKLPPRAQELLEAGHDHGGITLRQAEALAQVADWPAEILRVLAVKRHRYGPSLDDDIREAIKRAKVRRHAAETRARLQAEDLEVLDKPEDGWWDAPARPLKDQEHGRCIDYRAVDVDDHAGLACHTVAVCDEHGEAVLMCTDHRLHQAAEDTDRVPTAAELADRDQAKRAKEAAEKARARALSQAAKARHAHLRDVLADQVSLDADQVLEHLAWTLIEDNRVSPAKAACQLLGLGPYERVQTWASGTTHVDKDWRQALHNLAAKGRPELLQAAFALAMVIGEERASLTYRRWSQPADVRHFAMLRQLGYQLSAAEQTRLDAEQAAGGDVQDPEALEDLEEWDGEDEEAGQ